MGHYLDSAAHKLAFQRALNADLASQLKPPLVVDGKLGSKTADAVRLWRQVHGKPTGKDAAGAPIYAASVDNEMLRLLHLGPPLITEPGTLGNIIALPIIDFVLNQALKGTGINMDFAKISKAVAGGITAAIATTGTMAVVYLQLPPDAQTHFPSFVYSVLPWINEGIGFLVGFCGVYFAPANKPA